VRSRQVLFLMIESLVLKKQNVRETKKKRAPVMVYRQKYACIGGTIRHVGHHHY
jgi:hypothetical protein